MAFWPWLLKISPRLVSSLLTIAVEDSARPPPSKNAAVAGMPMIINAAPNSAPDVTT
ncbi:hypothetical protein D3C86_2140330 [compost metagenome]